MSCSPYLGAQDPECGFACVCVCFSSWVAGCASGGTALATEETPGPGQLGEFPLPRGGARQAHIALPALLPGHMPTPAQGRAAHRASVQAEAREHGASKGGEGAAADGWLLDEGAQAAVVVGARQVDHTRQVGQEVAQLLLHLLATELVVGVLQVVVRDQVGAARQLRVACGPRVPVAAEARPDRPMPPTTGRRRPPPGGTGNRPESVGTAPSQGRTPVPRRPFIG